MAVLQSVSIKKKSLEPYEDIVGPEVIDRIRALAEPLRGLRVLELNSTAVGGGVAELLTSTVPLLNAVGLDTEWKLLCRVPGFFQATKKIHNALQGLNSPLTDKERDAYLRHNEHCARMLEDRYDVIVVNDPQPVAVRRFARLGAKWIWRCHIDTSTPEPDTWGFIHPFVENYDALVFTLPAFVPPTLTGKRLEFIAPAIDPLSPKNRPLPLSLCQATVAEFGVDTERPLMLQVARFDPWKDPHGAIDAYRMVKQQMPGVQLALVGFMAADDPQGWDVYETIATEAQDDDDLFLFTNLDGVGGLEVNAFQRASQLVIQKSIKEGFGLAVSEALWKETPVVGGRAGGITLQMEDGVGGFLVATTEQGAERALYLLKHPVEAHEMAERGKERVRERFLVTRLLAEELELLQDITGRVARAA